MTTFAMGNRVLKIEKPKDQSTGAMQDQAGWKYTYFVRDASGTMMAIYEKTYSEGESGYLLAIRLAENPLYGSTRLGCNNAYKILETASFNASISSNEFSSISDFTEDTRPDYLQRTYYRGLKHYELSNHLGNVLVTVSDRKRPVDGRYVYVGSGGAYTLEEGHYINQNGCYNLEINSTPDGTADFYHAEILTANDYYPFGMLMPGRTYANVSTEGYRFEIKFFRCIEKKVQGYYPFGMLMPGRSYQKQAGKIRFKMTATSSNNINFTLEMIRTDYSFTNVTFNSQEEFSDDFQENLEY